MTCVVGLVEDKRVYIGGDSAGVGGYSISIRSDEKVFKRGSMIFGFTTSFRMGQLIRYSLKIPKKPNNKSDYEYLCTTFIDAVRNCFKHKGFITIKDHTERGGTFLLGYNQHLYAVESDFQVAKFALPYAACGCGDDLALGAMYALSGLDMPPEEKIKEALKAAETHSAGVAGPFTLVSV